MCKEREKVKKAQIFAPFGRILKPLLTALVLCWMTNTVFGVVCTWSSDCNCSPVNPDDPTVSTNTSSTINGNTSLGGTYFGPLNVWYFHRQINNNTTPSISFVLTAPGTYHVYYGDCEDSGSATCEWQLIQQNDRTPTVYTWTLGTNKHPGNTNTATGIKVMSFYRISAHASSYSYNTNWPVMTFSHYYYTNSTPEYCGFIFNNYNNTSVSFPLPSGATTFTINTIAGVNGYRGNVFPSEGDATMEFYNPITGTTSISSSGKQPLFTGMFAGTGLGCYYLLKSNMSALPQENFFQGVTNKSYTLAEKQFAYMFYDAACFGKKQYYGYAMSLPDNWFSYNQLQCGVNDLFKYMFRVDHNVLWAQYMDLNIS